MPFASCDSFSKKRFSIIFDVVSTRRWPTAAIVPPRFTSPS